MKQALIIKIRRMYQEVVRAIHRLPDKPWNKIMHGVTLLGGPLFITIAVVIMIVIAVLARKPLVGQLAALIIATHLINAVLKLIFRHPRPDTDYAKKILFSKYSFPSGHSSVGLVLWYSMPILLSTLGVPSGILLAMALSAPLLALAIGVSRVYLGAHYLIDVLVGWLLGLVCMISFAVIIL